MPDPVDSAVTRTPAPHAEADARIARKTAMARNAIGFERLWAALLWPFVTGALALALLLSGWLLLLPVWPRFAIMAAAVAVFLYSFKGITRLRWPSREEAMRRVEEKSGLAHRPVSGHGDRLTTDDPVQQAIFAEHKLRQLRALKSLRAGTPRSAWRDIDPRSLRLPAALALIVALILGPGTATSNLSDSLALAEPPPAIPLVMDAWLKPPAYTGKPPMLLTSPAMQERLAREPELTVPENAVLSLRITGAKAPRLSFFELADNEKDALEIKELKPKNRTSGEAFQSDTTLTRPALVKVMDGDREIGQWRIALLPDAPPSIEITEDPSGDSSGTLIAKWHAKDDYGVSSIVSDIYLADEQDDGTGFSDVGIFEYDAPRLSVPLRKASPKEESGTAKADVAQHPWAGFMVEMTLIAKDAAGHTTGSERRIFRMPERLFTKPLARALIEQRKHLILAPDEAGSVVQMLEALLAYPEGLIETSGIHLAIAAATARLKTVETGTDVTRDRIDDVVAMLWQIAVNVEEGASSDPKAQLEALRKELERAIREGASPERIAELTQKLREALDRYMQSLMAESQKRMQQGQQNPQQQQQQRNMQTVTPEQLQKMLDMIEKLAQSGNKDQAEQMLSQLEDILRNLQPGQGQQQQQQGQDGNNSELGQMLDKLSELMRKQQKLMDETQRSQQDPFGENQDPGQQGEPGQQGQGMDGLGDRQQGLSQMLQDLMNQLGKNGMPAPDAFGDAGESMKGAEGSLRGGDRDGALDQQGDAMAKLREGARGLAQQLLQQGQGQQGQQGRTGEARGDDRDPLGRPLPNSGEDYGPDRDMLPSELALQRAREILEMLRGKAGDSALPRLDRDYIDRLLRGLY